MFEWIRNYLHNLIASTEYVSVPATHPELDIERRYTVEERDDEIAYYSAPRTPPVHGFDHMVTHLGSIRDDTIEDEKDMAEFLFYLCESDLHELTHKYEDGVTTDTGHSDRWAHVFADIIWDINGYDVQMKSE